MTIEATPLFSKRRPLGTDQHTRIFIPAKEIERAVSNPRGITIDLHNLGHLEVHWLGTTVVRGKKGVYKRRVKPLDIRQLGELTRNPND